jgi:hypothetical protein
MKTVFNISRVKLFYFTIFSLIVLSGIKETYPQTSTGWMTVGFGKTKTDSVKAGDTTRVYNFALSYKNISFTVKDTGAFVTDSLKFYAGYIGYNSQNIAVDTTWETEPLVIEKSGDIDSTSYEKFYKITWGAGKNTNYQILRKNLQLLKVVLANEVYKAGRLVKYLITTLNE